MRTADNENSPKSLAAACAALDELRLALDRAIEKNNELEIANLRRAVWIAAATIDEIAED